MLIPIPILFMGMGCRSNIGSTSTSEIPKAFKPFLAGSIHSTDLNRVLADLPFDSIRLERFSGRSPRPSYQVTFNRDLSAKFIPLGELNPDGVLTGQVDPFAYGRLCYLLDQSRIRTFQSKYSAHRLHAELVTLTISTSDGQIIVSDFGGVAPIEFWGLVQAVDSIRHETTWAQSKEKPHEPIPQKP